MLDWLLETFTAHPYLTASAVFVICGLGFPIPEEVVLVAAGYACFKNVAEYPPMAVTCGLAILAGDLVPYLLGRTFGTRLLRIRPLRMIVTKRRLRAFDDWFRRRGDLVIFVARFLTGVRLAAYFTAGTMRTPFRRFVLLDAIGIALVAPVIIGLGYHFGAVIDSLVAKVQQVERGMLIAAGAALAVLAAWWWLRQRQQRIGAAAEPRETFVGPSIPSSSQPARSGNAGADSDAAAAPNEGQSSSSEPA